MSTHITRINVTPYKYTCNTATNNASYHKYLCILLITLLILLCNYTVLSVYNNNNIYDVDVEIYSIEPLYGSLYGNTLLTIIGKSFDTTSNVYCEFNNNLHTLAIVINSTTLTCVTPSYQQILNYNNVVFNGTTIDVAIQQYDYNNLLTTANNVIQYTYTLSSNILTLTPTVISSNTNTLIQLTLAQPIDITQSIYCIIDNTVNVTATIINSTSLTCISPIYNLTTTTKQVLLQLSYSNIILDNVIALLQYVQPIIINSIKPVGITGN